MTTSALFLGSIIALCTCATISELARGDLSNAAICLAGVLANAGALGKTMGW